MRFPTPPARKNTPPTNEGQVSVLFRVKALTINPPRAITTNADESRVRTMKRTISGHVEPIPRKAPVFSV
jgi:hypothetical protein